MTELKVTSKLLNQKDVLEVEENLATKEELEDFATESELEDLRSDIQEDMQDNYYNKATIDLKLADKLSTIVVTDNTSTGTLEEMETPFLIKYNSKLYLVNAFGGGEIFMTLLDADQNHYFDVFAEYDEGDSWGDLYFVNRNIGGSTPIYPQEYATKDYVDSSAGGGGTQLYKHTITPASGMGIGGTITCISTSNTQVTSFNSSMRTLLEGALWYECDLYKSSSPYYNPYIICRYAQRTNYIGELLCWDYNNNNFYFMRRTLSADTSTGIISVTESTYAIIGLNCTDVVDPL